MRGAGLVFGLSLGLCADAAIAQGLSRELIDECLLGLRDVELCQTLMETQRPSTFDGRLEPPLGADTEWRRDDRVLTIERPPDPRAHVPYDPTLPGYRHPAELHLWIAPELPPISLPGGTSP